MKFVFTCGGTAGHINPALAVAGRLRKLLPDSEMLFIGAEGKMEMELVPREGYRIEGLKITNISREHSLSGIVHNLDTLKNVAVSLHEAKRLIREFKPDAVIGTGGYVCYPVLTAAHELHIPTFVHESNAVPGLTTKMLAEHVDRVLVGFEDSRRYYKHPDRVEVTGTPVRGEFGCETKEQAKAELGIPAGEKLVVSVWGSLGAGHMNEVLTEMIPMLDGRQGFRLLHAAGGNRGEHEFLNVHVVGRVYAAIEHVHHDPGQLSGGQPAQIPIQGQMQGGGRRPGAGHGNRENRIRAA